MGGNLCPERDVEGYLYGRCYDCCRGRGPQCAEDLYANIKDDATEDELKVNNDCEKLHMKRADVEKIKNELQDRKNTRPP